MDLEEKERIRREKLAEFFFNLANTTAGTTVIGMIVSFAFGVENKVALNIVVTLVFGVITTIAMARVGNSLLKQ